MKSLKSQFRVPPACNAPNKYLFGGTQPWRERVFVIAAKQLPDGFWLKVSAANSQKGIPPMLYIESGTSIIIEETESNEWQEHIARLHAQYG
jgi:hypothetical protein